MMLHQGKIDLIVWLQTCMSHTYSKKDDNPSKTISLFTFVSGFVTLTVWDNLGMVSKKFSISLNCFEFNWSKNSTISFFVQSADVQDSSSLYIWSIHEIIKSNDSSTPILPVKSKLLFIYSTTNLFFSKILSNKST